MNEGPSIRARGLVKTYGKFVAVDGIDFQVMPGECFGILGPNGAGKTTTIHMICGLVDKTAGELTILGMDVVRDIRRIKRRIGVMPQDENLDRDLTARDNLDTHARYHRMSRDEARTRAREVLEFVQLTEHAGRKINELSGGMKRRLLLGRAFLSDPAVMLLDEPTAGLDPQARLVVWQKVRELKSLGVAVVLTTHYMDEAERLCDRVAIMDHGRIVATGEPVDLIRTHVPREVIEVHSTTGQGPSDEWSKEAGDDVRVETSRGTTYVYGNDLDGWTARLSAMEGLHFSRRPSNLEDVFLTLTGRDLRE